MSDLDLSRARLINGNTPPSPQPQQPQCKYLSKVMPNMAEAAMGQIPSFSIVGASCMRDVCTHWDAEEQMCSDLVAVKLLKQLVNKENTDV